MVAGVLGTRTACANCQGPIHKILDLGTTPLADKFPASEHEPEKRFPLQLMLCDSCYLVQLGHVVPDEILWSDYGFYASTSPALTAYHDAFAELVHTRYGVPNLTVEIACNDGSLLKRLPGARKFGIDAAKGPVTAGQEAGLDIHHGLFGRSTAYQLVEEYGTADLIVAQNVVAHTADLKDFFAGLATLLDVDGVAIIEFQALADLVLGNQIDHVYHEHRFFFSEKSFRNVATSSGFRIVTMERTPMQGGSIRATLRKGTEFVPQKIFGYSEDLITGTLSLNGLQARALYLKDRLNELLMWELQNGVVAGYAASAKSTTLLNWCGITKDQIQFIVDTTPHKIGRVSPGTHIPIVGPGDRPDPDTYLLLVHNYLGRIRKEPFQGRWLVPVPHPVVI